MTEQNETQVTCMFVGPRQVLVRFKELSRDVVVYALQNEPNLCAVALSDDLHDAMLEVFGTGDWLKNGPGISTGDMAVAARMSKGASLAYIEIGAQVGTGRDQSAAAWKDEALVTKPVKLNASDAANRPRSLWPINIALKQLGVKAAHGFDEAQTIGLYDLAAADDISTVAVPIA